MFDRAEALLAAVLFFTFAYFYQGGFSNQNTRWDLALAIVYEGRPVLDTFHRNTLDKARAGAHFQADKSPLVSWLAVPAALVTRALIPEKRLLADEGAADLSLWLGTVLTVSLLSALSAPCFARLLRQLHPALPPGAALAATATVYLGTLLFPYSTVLFGHPIAAAFLVLALHYRATDRLAGAALCFSLMGVTELTTVPVALWFWADSARRVPTRRWARASLAALPPLVCLALHETWCWGSPFTLGYGRLEGTPFATGMARGIFGVGWPSPIAAYQLLFGGYRGLFFYCPVLIAALAGHAVWRAGRIYLGAAAIVLGINAGYFYWQGGPCFGPRHLVVAIPLVALGIGALPKRRATAWVVGALSLPSIAINLVGTSVLLFPDEWDRFPLRGLFHSWSHDQLSRNPMSFTTPFLAQGERWRDAAAHAGASLNLGEWLGMSGRLSLLPLVLVWCLVAAAAIMKGNRISPSTRKLT